MLLSSVLAMTPVHLTIGMENCCDEGVRDTNAPAAEPAGATQVTRRTSDAGADDNVRPDKGNGHWRAHSTDDPQGTICKGSLRPYRGPSQRGKHPQALSGAGVRVVDHPPAVPNPQCPGATCVCANTKLVIKPGRRAPLAAELV